jgi:Leucine-rich repeat (LRR) protein
MTTWNKYDYNEWVKSGCPKNDDIIILNCSYNNLDSLVGIENLTNLMKLACDNNNLDSLVGIENLTNLTELYCSYNQLTSLSEIENLTNLTILYCSDNKLSSLVGIKNLTNLTDLHCYNNQLDSLVGIENIINLITLWCGFNNLKSLVEIKNLINLTILDCSNNQLDSLVGIENLSNLIKLYCSQNQLTNLESIKNFTNLIELYCYYNKLNSLAEIKNLTNLTELDCSYNQLDSLVGIENLTNLRKLSYSNNPIDHIPPNLLRRINRIKNGQNIYTDNQNVHNHNIQESIRESIQNILKFKPTIKNLNNLILDDNILTQNTKEILIEYSEDTSVHTILNITFGELLFYVFNRIQINEHKDEIKKILNVEMHESVCKCFTGRISRLINCLNGFDELVNIKIAGSEQISQIISLTQNKLIKKGNYSVELHREQVKNSLIELDYDNNIINEWVNYIE